MVSRTRDLSGEKLILFCRFHFTVRCNDFVIIVNLSDEKLDFFFARFAGLYNCNDFVLLVN